ncbi:MAG: glycosyltransferase family 4 protein [Solirubrobacteraceae bacterium]
MILFVHHRYRTAGGEERAVDDFLGIVRDRLGEPAELLARDSSDVGPAQAAAGLLAGGLRPGEVADAVRRTGARVVHAHNVHPTFGWRALAAARRAGAGVVLHLHNYRLVCAVGTCHTRGADCARCHGLDTTPGLRLACRGSRAEAAAYAAGIALAQRRLVALADRIVVPSDFALDRLRALGAPLDPGRVDVLPPPVAADDGPSAAASGRYALVAGRLAPEKGVELAIDACAAAGVPLVVAGDGPAAAALRRRAAATGAEVRFHGPATRAELRRLRAGAALALVPSRAAETFGLAAAEAMAAGVPVLVSGAGALPSVAGDDAVVAGADPAAWADAITRRYGDAAAGDRGRDRIATRCEPGAVGARLAAIYAAAG